MSNTAQNQLGSTLLNRLVELRSKKGNIQIEDVGEIFEHMTQSLGQEATQQGAFLRDEIQKMAADINAAKQEIFALQPDDESSRSLGSASNQLSAVVKFTEDATNEILNAADELQALAGTLTGEAKDKLDATIARIYEACNFQDLTTQRISKATAALEYIDQRLTRLSDLFGTDGPKMSAGDVAKIDKNADKRADKHLLNGPSDGAPNQEQIDALFSSLAAGTKG